MTMSWHEYETLWPCVRYFDPECTTMSIEAVQAVQQQDQESYYSNREHGQKRGGHDNDGSGGDYQFYDTDEQVAYVLHVFRVCVCNLFFAPRNDVSWCLFNAMHNNVTCRCDAGLFYVAVIDNWAYPKSLTQHTTIIHHTTPHHTYIHAHTYEGGIHRIFVHFTSGVFEGGRGHS